MWVGSPVGIATDYGLDGPRSNPGGDEIFRPSRPALGPTRTPANGYRDLPWGKVRPGRAADHSPRPIAQSLKSRAIPGDSCHQTFLHLKILQLKTNYIYSPFIICRQIRDLCGSNSENQNITTDLFVT